MNYETVTIVHQILHQKVTYTFNHKTVFSRYYSNPASIFVLIQQWYSKSDIQFFTPLSEYAYFLYARCKDAFFGYQTHMGITFNITLNYVFPSWRQKAINGNKQTVRHHSCLNHLHPLHLQWPISCLCSMKQLIQLKRPANLK